MRPDPPSRSAATQATNRKAQQTAAARRKQTQRARLEAGRVVLHGEFDEYRLVAAARIRGLVRTVEDPDRCELNKLLAAVIEDWMMLVAAQTALFK